MRGKIGDKEGLGHILDAIAEIESYTANVGLESFLSNSMMRFASIKQIEVIGEAANYITRQAKQYKFPPPQKNICVTQKLPIHLRNLKVT